MSSYVTLTDLVKRFGTLVAVDGISLQVDRGEVLGFIGPNGAGKSTTMKMATGYWIPDAGSVEICGVSMRASEKEAKRRIGYLPEGAPAYGDMTPAGFLKFISEVRGYSGRERRRRIDLAVARAELGGVLHQRIETLSKGFKRRVGLAQAILHEPEVLILDEPTDGLDPNQKHHVRTLITEMARNSAIIISTHILEEVEAVCSRAVLIDRGRVVFDGTPPVLQARDRRHNSVVVRIEAPAAPEAERLLGSIASVSAVEHDDGANGIVTLTAVARDPRTIATDVAEAIARSGIRVEEITIQPGQLERVFRELTTSDTSSGHA
jgi:ABC-2 type transport system ATP-binding protein